MFNISEDAAAKRGTLHPVDTVSSDGRFCPMKKKQVIGFSLVLILALAFTFFGSYALSRKASEEENDIIYSTEKANLQAVDAIKEEVVQSGTEIVYEIYRLNYKEKEEIIKPPAKYVGTTRKELIDILKEELKNQPLEEVEKGLENLELLSFSRDRVVIRKSYGKEIPYKFCLFIENGSITVYYSDKKTIYSYTDIPAEALPEAVRQELYNGKEINSLGALYDFLETYSS